MGFFKSIAKVGQNIGKTVAKAAKDTGNATKKAVVDTGHVAGAVATSKVGQAVIGSALAVSGVGLPAAAAIGATAKGGGALIKKGGNLGKAGNAAVQGAAVGAGSAVVGAAVRTVKAGEGFGGFKNVLLKGKGALDKKPEPPPAMIEPAYAVEAIVPGMTDSGVLKHDATDLNNPREEWLKQQKETWASESTATPKNAPTDMFTPLKRRLLGSGAPTNRPGSDVDAMVDPVVKFRNGKNDATTLPDSSAGEVATETAPKAEPVKDNLPMLLAVGAAGVIMVVVLGMQRRK
jgi:hypothetical protein